MKVITAYSEIADAGQEPHMPVMHAPSHVCPMGCHTYIEIADAGQEPHIAIYIACAIPTLVICTDRTFASKRTHTRSSSRHICITPTCAPAPAPELLP